MTFAIRTNEKQSRCRALPVARFRASFGALLGASLLVGACVAEDVESENVRDDGAMLTSGNTAVGSQWELLGSNSKSVTQITVSQAATVTKLTAYEKGVGTSGTQALRGVIYADASGSPGKLLGTTQEVAQSGTAAAAWVAYKFASPITLAAGKYWIGNLVGLKNQLTQRAFNPGGAAMWNTDTYSDGATSTFGAPKPYTASFSMYATYTATSTGTDAGTVGTDAGSAGTDAGHDTGSGGGGLPSLGTIGFDAYLIDSSINVNATTVAQRSNFIVVQRWRTDLLSQLKAANPKIKVLFYANLTGMIFPDGSGNYSGGVNPTGVPESYFLHTASGSRFTFNGYDYIWAANHGNAAYQQAWAQNVVSIARSKGFDGVFLDDTNSLMSHHTPSTDVQEFPTNDSYAHATLGILQTVAPRLEAAGLLAIPNMGGTWGQYADWMDQYLAVDGISGGLDEFFEIWPGGQYQPQAFIDRAIQSQQKAEALGKYYFATTLGGEAQATFGLASCLLTSAGHVAFFAPTAASGYGNEPWYSEYDAAAGLGQPQGAKYQTGSLWRRDFANGYVTVDFPNHIGQIVRTR